MGCPRIRCWMTRSQRAGRDLLPFGHDSLHVETESIQFARQRKHTGFVSGLDTCMHMNKHTRSFTYTNIHTHPNRYMDAHIHTQKTQTWALTYTRTLTDTKITRTYTNTNTHVHVYYTHSNSDTYTFTPGCFGLQSSVHTWWETSRRD
jgi:hypothetical protein